MTDKRIAELLKNGEGLTIEFKLCSGKVEHDVFESICASCSGKREAFI